ncbi:hypothetical protein F4Y93_00690 [Candidatus Poribacteria bacterium]|nr:hypothetical protein [Candidatus Poribacteria bacterium]
MTARTLTRFLVPAFFGLFAVASAQLPPEIMVDKYLIEAEQLHAVKDQVGAFNAMEKILALQKEHNLTLPDGFHFKYARVALSADSLKIALESVNKYLSTTGKEGEFYKEALALLFEVEVAQETQISVEETCAGDPERSNCWMALANHPECYLWKSYHDDIGFDATATAIWSGKCLGSVAQGEGTISWTYFLHPSYDYSKGTITSTGGSLQKGKLHGSWIHRFPWGEEIRTSYMHGKRHGQWVRRDSVGTVRAEGAYLEDKKHGQWVYRNPHGAIDLEGSYVGGKRHGPWVEEYDEYGTKEIGSYVDGKRHGQWVRRKADGTIYYVRTYVNGELQQTDD